MCIFKMLLHGGFLLFGSKSLNSKLDSLHPNTQYTNVSNRSIEEY